MKIYSGVWKKPKTLKMAILARNVQILSVKSFGGHLRHIETQLHGKNQKNGQGWNARTHIKGTKNVHGK